MQLNSSPISASLFRIMQVLCLSPVSTYLERICCRIPLPRRIEGQYLNDVLPGPPTAEMLACWILGRLPIHWEWVVIRAYDGFMCRVTRKELSPWLSSLR